jgi:hypothetical protein
MVFLDKDYSDEAYLELMINMAKLLSQASRKQMIAIKNSQSEHVFCNNHLLALMGVKAEEILGKTILLPLYNNDSAFEPIIHAEDQAIIDSREAKLVFKINHFTTGLTPYISVKTPLINPSTGNVVGILFQGLEMRALPQHYTLLKSYGKKGKVNRHTALPKLTKREKQVIFFFMANLGSQEIADMLHTIEGKPIAKSTIDSLFLDQLYVKFEVSSRPALYKKLQALGYDTLIPGELLKSASVLLDVAKVY